MVRLLRFKRENGPAPDTRSNPWNWRMSGFDVLPSIIVAVNELFDVLLKLFVPCTSGPQGSDRLVFHWSVPVEHPTPVPAWALKKKLAGLVYGGLLPVGKVK